MLTRCWPLLALLLAAAPASACPTHDVVLTPGGASDAPKQVEALLDTPFVKLVRITLRGGTELADHAVPTAITVQALAGKGTLHTGDQADPLAADHVVLVAPGARHKIVPAGKEDLVLLVHLLKMGAAAGTPAAACDHHPGGPKGEHPG
ncbi:MAG: hypothetical protein KC549_11460, partial [Myxococcales bacterium]|nr:hypothetical protein [Myxococcales bacterium]